MAVRLDDADGFEAVLFMDDNISQIEKLFRPSVEGHKTVDVSQEEQNSDLRIIGFQEKIRIDF